ncbi:MAG: discoidin domain-containing protein [Anaerolineae bacterium]|nr:discoidin domain-containing protein [Anaerolineae bacterium]
MKISLQLPRAGHTHQPDPDHHKEEKGYSWGWLVIYCASITLIVCLFSWVATFNLLPERVLASGGSMLAADYSPWQGYQPIELDVVRLATAAAQGDAPWQGESFNLATSLPPATAIQITSQATPLPTSVPTEIVPTRRPILPGPTNTLPPTILVVTSTATTAPTSPPPAPTNPPAPTSPPSATNTPVPAATDTPIATDTPTATATSTSTPTDTPTPTDTATPTETPTPIPVSNLALGQPATASSVEAGNPVEAGNDGNISTRWCAVDETMPQWWAVDLGASYNLVGTEVMWEFDGRVYQYFIEVSPDNASWTTVVDKTGNTSTSQVQTDNFTATARYVRITVVWAPTSPTTWASFYEFRVFGN